MKEQTATVTTVEDVLDSPGQPLPSSVHDSFARRFGPFGPALDGNGDDPVREGPWGAPAFEQEDRFERQADRAAAHVVRHHYDDRSGDTAVSPWLDFSSVRIHADTAAAGSASALSADAYTVGHDIVFGAGRYDTRNLAGQNLLAHELAHVVQQETGAVEGPAIQPRHGGRNFAIWLGFIEGEFEDRELIEYLARIERIGGPEGTYLSDNMARAIVRRWMAAEEAFQLDGRQKILLIEEMLDGPTLKEDEEGILNLLENSDNADLRIMFRGGLKVEDLRSDIDGEERTKRLEDFFSSRFEGGAPDLLSGHVQPIGSPGPAAPKFAYAWPALLTRIEGIYSTEDIVTWIKNLTADERDQAVADLEKHRVEVRNDIIEAGDKGLPEQLLETRRKALQRIDDVLQPLYLDIALNESSFETSQRQRDIEPGDKPAIKESLRPPAKQSGSGGGSTPTFTDEAGFKTKIRDLLTDRIQNDYDRFVVDKGEVEHADPDKVDNIDRLVKVAEASANETDQVFGGYKTGPPFKAGSPDSPHPGDIIDQWEDVQADLTDTDFDEDDRKDLARDLIMHYLQTMSTAFDIYREHNANPEFGPDDSPINDEAKALEAVAQEFLNDPAEVKRLNEIERGWPGSQAEGVVFVQIFKKATEVEDRSFLWLMFQVLIHEYLHTLVDEDKYDAHAKSFGESSLEYNTLIEGVDSFLTEIVWANAKTHVQQADVREKVEGPTYAALPFEQSAIPPITKIRYPSYNQAAQLVAIVGVRNLYDAYFFGEIDRIGG